MSKGMGGHQSARAITNTWLTPPHVIDALGGWRSFDLDPCAPPILPPWRTAKVMNRLDDADGLSIEWFGRVYCNMPYDDVPTWLSRLHDHGNGTALIFARTETTDFFDQVWDQAHGLLFIRGRLHFHRLGAVEHPDICAAYGGHDWYEYEPKKSACRRCEVAKFNSGAPSVLCAYGPEELDRLAASNVDGKLVPLRFARFAVVAGLDLSWSKIMREWVSRQPGPVSVSDAYRFFARHPKSRSNPNWRAKVRQKLMQVADRVGPNQYAAAA